MSRSLFRERLKKAEMVVGGGESLHHIAVQFSSDAKWVFLCRGNCVQVYGYSSHQVVCTLRHDSPVTAALVNPRNHLQLITTQLAGRLTLWDYMDGALLRMIDFGVPLCKLALRPGREEPLLFFAIEKAVAEVSVVGVSSHMIKDRDPVVAPGEQLKEAIELVTTSRPRDIRFTHTGAHLVTCSGNGKKLIVYDFETEQHYRYRSRYGITTLACHPSQLCIATGNSRGEIKIWSNFAQRGCSEVVTILHWHAHAVGGLCFSTDGSYLVSGGEEGVMVLWQLKTGHKDFRPRLGSPITRITCSPDDACFAVSLQNNVIRLVSGLNSEVEGTLGGLRRAHVTTPGENGVRTGLMLHPQSKALVLNSTPGLLQFYDTETQHLSSELDVAGLNVVSRTDAEPIIPTTVDHVAFSPSGDWMITVESRDNGKTAPELRMKFWKFMTTHQRYVQNTCVDPPHDKAVISLSFQPSSHTPARDVASSADSAPSLPLAVTSSLDERFKVWLLVDTEEEEEEGGEGRGRGSSWACRSVGYYRKLCPMGAVFSQDGSLLAVNFTKAVTVWDPYSCDLRQTFSTPYPNETFKQLVFGQHDCSQYLLASATEHLHVWDLLSCRLLWRVGVSVSYLVADPLTHLAAAFVASKEASLLYLLEPSCATPLSVHALPSNQDVVGAVFVPRTWDPKQLSQHPVLERSSLYFITRDQVLYYLNTSAESADSSGDLAPTTRSVRAEVATPAHKSFMEIFGQRKRPNGLYTSTDPASHLPLSLALLEAPPHVLAPPSILSAQFLRRLLPAPADTRTDTTDSRTDTTRTAHTRTAARTALSPGNSAEPDDVTGVERGVVSSSEEEEEDIPPKAKAVKRLWNSPPAKNNGSKRDTDIVATSSYKWLVDYFGSSNCT